MNHSNTKKKEPLVGVRSLLKKKKKCTTDGQSKMQQTQKLFRADKQYLKVVSLTRNKNSKPDRCS